MGFLLLLTKWGSFWLLTGGEKQWYIWYPLKKGGAEPVRDWTYRSSVRKGIVDIGAGYLGMHVLTAFGGSIIAMISMVTYTITCMTIIFLPYIGKWFERKIKRIIYGRRYIIT